MITIKVTGINEIKKNLDSMSKGAGERAIRQAINKVADKARAEINRAIPEEYAVKASEVRNAVELRRSSGADLKATITVFGSSRRRGRSMNMIHFLSVIQAAGKAMKARGAKVSKKDMKAIGRRLGFTIRKDGGLKKIEGVFLGNKGRTVFRRTGKGRLPIEPVQVIGFSQMFNSRKINERVMKKINDELPVEVQRAVANVLRGLK